MSISIKNLNILTARLLYSDMEFRLLDDRVDSHIRDKTNDKLAKNKSYRLLYSY